MQIRLSSGLAGFAAGVTIGVLSVIAIVPNARLATSTASGQQDSPPPGGGGPIDVPTAGTNPTGIPTAGATRGPGGGTGSGLACAPGRNGGATDVGVSPTEIKLGATIVRTGIGAAFLGEVQQAMEAYRNKINRAGGVCGRLLKILYKDDGWSRTRGFEFLQNLVEDARVFALAVAPSSEGVDEASQNGYFAKQRVPVVGTDGMIRSQYTDPYVWPVAVATVSQMHVIAKDAWDRGGRNLAIVFDSNYRFGVEGAFAFEKAYERLSGGKKITGYTNPLEGGGATCPQGSRFCGIPAGQGQYQNQVKVVNDACEQEPKCDFMALLLEPDTAAKWFGTFQAPTPEKFQFKEGAGMAAAQPLFTRDFAEQCSQNCHLLRVWTGYNPNIEQFRDDPAVREYVSDLDGQSSSADPFNQFTQGGYLGMKLLVEALKAVGPNLTRARLVAALNSMTLRTGLAPTLAWRAGVHFANPAAQAFEIQAQNGFSGWRFVTDYVTDPWLGQDTG